MKIIKNFFLILLLTSMLNIHAIKIDRVILATDANPDYIEFWPIVAKAWKEIIGITPTLALIAPADTIIDETLGDVIRFEPIEGIPPGFQAQAIRLLLPAYFENDVCIISDIDMIPLHKEYFLDSVKNYSADTFIVYRSNAYSYYTNVQFPMCYLAAQGKTFKEIFGIKQISDIPAIIQHWANQKLGWYSDEILLYTYLTNWHNYHTKCIKLGHYVQNRIDRSYWEYDTKLLKQNFYIDAHCPRPYSKHKQEIDAIVETVITSNKKLAQNMKKNRFLDNDYCTHMAPLFTVVMHTDGPVLEMGSGDFSTPLLHALCSKEKRFLLTTDTDNKWINNFIDLRNEWHHFIYVPVYEDDWSINPKPTAWDSIGNNVRWSVVLIDHRPGERRVEDIRRLRNNTDIFVVHDTQQPSYSYEPILNTFKYKYVYERYKTQTTLVSDTIDVATFFNE